ncbi:hypothetical protein EXX13_23420, partial [Escherichia coli]
MSIHNDHRRWFHSYQSHRSGQFSVRAGNCTLIHENTGWICPYISRHLLSLNPLLARCRRYSR